MHVIDWSKGKDFFCFEKFYSQGFGWCFIKRMRFLHLCQKCSILKSLKSEEFFFVGQLNDLGFFLIHHYLFGPP